MLSHLGAMLARREAMLAQHTTRNARRQTKTQTKIKISQKSRNPMLRRVRPRFPPGTPQGRRLFWGKVGPVMGAMWAHVGGHVASAGPCWADLGPMLPHLGSMLAHLKHMLSNLGPMLAQKMDEPQKPWKNPWIRKVLATMLRLCWPILEAMLVHLGAILARLGAMLARLKAMLAHLGR